MQSEPTMRASIDSVRSGRVSLSIRDGIGIRPDGSGVSASDVARQLAGLDVSTIDVYLSSAGGQVFEGRTIYAILKDHPARIVVTIDGIAAGAASVIAMAGDEIRMPASARLILNSLKAVVIAGDGNAVRKRAADLDTIDGVAAAIFAVRSGNPVETVRAWMQADREFTAAEARVAGLCDIVLRTAATDGRYAEAVAAWEPRGLDSLVRMG